MMANFKIKKSVWDMISPEAKERMMDEGDVVIFEDGGTEVWTRPRETVLIIRRQPRPESEQRR